MSKKWFAYGGIAASVILIGFGIGSIFIGAVHDFSTLVASVRHEGRSIAGVVKTHFGPRAWVAILAFIWLALVYVIVAFVDVTASTFVTGDADVKGLTFRFNQGGAVALGGSAGRALGTPGRCARAKRPVGGRAG